MTYADRRLAWKLARAEYERLSAVCRHMNNGGTDKRLVKTRRGLLEAASIGLHLALEDACE